MIKRKKRLCLASALLAGSVAASASAGNVAALADNAKTSIAAKSAVFSQAPTQETPYDLRQRSAPILALDTTRERRSPVADRSMAIQRARYGDGAMEYIEGPSVSYQGSRNGPVFEAGALGGGMESAPFLAHVAMNWQF